MVRALVAIPFVLFARTFCASSLPRPGELAGPLPSASPPADMAIFHLPTGMTHRSASFAYRGGSGHFALMLTRAEGLEASGELSAAVDAYADALQLLARAIERRPTRSTR